MKNIKGFTLVEALVAMTIVIFVVVSILSGFTQQMVTNRFAGSKNVAINLAESKIEEYLKFPGSQISTGTIVDFLVERNKRLVPTTDSNLEDLYKRTAAVNDVGTMKEIRVTVEYGKHGARYPFRVVLTSMKGG